MYAPADPQLVAMVRSFSEHIPFNAELGIEILQMGKGRVRMRLPFQPKLVGNPDIDAYHGGAVTSLLDATAGLAAFLAPDEPRMWATLDLRIDYMKPALARDLLAEAHAYKVTRTIAFVRATAFHDSPDDPVATATGSFMSHELAQPGSGG